MKNFQGCKIWEKAATYHRAWPITFPLVLFIKLPTSESGMSFLNILRNILRKNVLRFSTLNRAFSVFANFKDTYLQTDGQFWHSFLNCPAWPLGHAILKHRLTRLCGKRKSVCLFGHCSPRLMTGNHLPVFNCSHHETEGRPVGTKLAVHFPRAPDPMTVY